MSTESAGEPGPHPGENTPAAASSRSERFRNWMLALSAIAIPLVGAYYASRDKDREVAKDFVEISIKILSENPNNKDDPLRQWAVDVLSQYSPVKIDEQLKQLLLNKPLYASGTKISEQALQHLEQSGMVRGIILSIFSSTPPAFADLKTHSVKFLYIKASNGTRSADSRVGDYVSQARNTGMKVGLYHFYDPAADENAQFAAFQSILAQSKWDLPPMIDCETYPGHPIPADYASKVADFAKNLESAFHVKPVIYTGRAFADISLDKSVAQYPLFIANFGTAVTRGAPMLPKWWTQYEFWHVSEGLTDDPVLQRYDIVAFKGTEAELGALVPAHN